MVQKGSIRAKARGSGAVTQPAPLAHDEGTGEQLPEGVNKLYMGQKQ